MAAVSGVMLLAASCTHSTNTGSAIVEDVPPEAQRIHFDTPPFEGEVMRYLSFEDSWQREDLAAFQGPDQRAEAALISIKPGQQGALDHPFNIERSLTTWSYLDTKPLSLGPSQRIPMRGRIAFSRSFALPDDNQSCAGFVSSWDFPGGDPQGRPGKLMFGYLCQSETPLDQATIDQFLRNIELREAAEPDASNGTETAQPTGSFGNNAFPFRLARRYIIGNGVIRQ